MTDKTQDAIFAREVERRMDELISWSIANAPHKSVQLTPKDFKNVRQEFCRIATCNSQLLSEPEPEEGGSQYINDNPAPWP